MGRSRWEEVEMSQHLKEEVMRTHEELQKANEEL